MPTTGNSNFEGERGWTTSLLRSRKWVIASRPVPRVALISDGRENKGSIARAAWQAQQLGIPIDTFAMNGRPQPALRLEAVSLPALAVTGEQFAIDLLVSTPQRGAAEIESVDRPAFPEQVAQVTSSQIAEREIAQKLNRCLRVTAVQGRPIKVILIEQPDVPQKCKLAILEQVSAALVGIVIAP